jgi:NTE family protein
MNGLRLLQDLTLGGVLGGAGMQSLLDATPLRAFLGRHLPLENLSASILEGHLYALAVTATSYHSGKSYTFVHGQPGHPLWVKSRRVTLPVEINLNHVLASAAIPIVFQPVKVKTERGEFYFGDGGLRLVTPLSPAIRLGASKVFAVGIRCQRTADDLTETELEGSAEAVAKVSKPPLSQICGVFMNAIFLDHLDADLDHLQRMNELIMAYGQAGAPAPDSKVAPTLREPMRIVQPMAIHPSEDLAMVAKRLAHRMPRMVRYLLDGLGTPDASSADLMSYLLLN